MSTFILAGRIVLPDRLLEDGFVLCSEGRIHRVGTGAKLPKDVPVINAGTGWIVPGFLDIHVHGGDGADYMDGTPEAVRTINRAHARHGTTTIFPTTTTGSPEEIARMLDSCRQVRRNWQPQDGARIGGVHLYGPYFAPNKVGCHAEEGRRDPTAEEYASYFKDDLVRIATCAAELPGAEGFYRAARRRKRLVTCGHSNATWTEMDRAFRAGMRHVDHFWCAMSSVASLRAQYGTPMRGSMEQFVLANPEMSTEVIADGQHLSPELLEFAWRMKGPHRLCLVTDANRALGMPPGQYRFGNEASGSWFESDGKVGFARGAGLASSVVGLDTMVRTMLRDTPAPLHEVIRMASLTPAERAGVVDEVGSIEKGKRADLVILDRKYQVRRVWLAGEEFRPGKS